MRSDLQKIFLYDGRDFRPLVIESAATLRWGCWTKDGKGALLVGNRGAIFQLVNGKVDGLHISSSENLRCAEFSPTRTSALIVGNNGTILKLDNGVVNPVHSESTVNLRRVAWKPDGTSALLVGNEGAAYRFVDGTSERIDGAGNNLRSISWHPGGKYAIVSGNCFRPSPAGLVPASNLYKYEEANSSLEPLQTLSESRADLISSAWRPDGSICPVIGFDSVWHTPTILTYNGEKILHVPWTEERVCPTSFAWHPSGEYGLIGTGGLTSDDEDGRIYKFHEGKFIQIRKLDRLWVSCIKWSGDGRALIITSRTKAFSV